MKNYARHKKTNNTLWEMKEKDGSKVWRFKDIANLGFSHFKNIYHKLGRANITDIVKITSYFPRVIKEGVNEVSKEFKVVVKSFQKEKIPGHNGWSIYFYLGFYDYNEEALLKVVEESRKILNSINFTFITLIPKKMIHPPLRSSHWFPL